ncbi:MAG: malto-oligosyltrehalose synthase, partial [Chloroflexi bacterium]|nr:malto-oligosyltrehalose synthase [Chloroflexota bacterium]
MASQRIPVSTYRLQFNSSFRFSDARTIVPYLRRLGISDLYASPIFKATPGSTHGYDITDPTCFNPELGSEEEFSALVEELKKHGMGLLLDIVPNHLAASPDNPWWLDVLESGLWSPYADFFDINWNPIDSPLKNKILLPILGHHYRDALENGELVLALEDNNLFVRYYDYRLPLEIKSYGQVLSHNLDTLEERLDGSTLAVQQLKIIIESMNNLLPLPSTAAAATIEQYKQRQAIKKECRRLLNTSPEIKNFLGGNLKSFNGNKGKPASSELLEQLLAQQVYQLAYWKTAHSDINYRRFFDINDLIGIRVELTQVFAATHTLIFRLAREGKVSGLRVDHIDGLYDPQEYLLRLQDNMSEPGIYTVTEKILSGNEVLPGQWPVCGTTGYDFLNQANSLFIDYKGLKALREHYSQLTGVTSDFCSVAYEKKKKVIEELFPGEISRLGLYLHQVIQQDEKANNLSMEELKEALIEVTACLPVYRTYIRAFDVSPSDKDYLELAFGEARQRCLSIKSEVWDSLKRVLSLDFPPGFSPEQKE